MLKNALVLQESSPFMKGRILYPPQAESSISEFKITRNKYAVFKNKYIYVMEFTVLSAFKPTHNTLPVQANVNGIVQYQFFDGACLWYVCLFISNHF